MYRTFARAASGAYFLIQSLKSVNYMYQFDLPTYITLFKVTPPYPQVLGCRFYSL